jgi:Bacterial membrane protein YfhO
VEVPEATDLTSFVPRPRELGPGDYDPASVARLVPWLRNAAVTRVLSLDPLESGDLRLLDTVPTGPPGLAIRVYGLARAWPRAYVACRVAVVPGIDAALRFPYAPGFRPGADVALNAGPAATCRSGIARRVFSASGAERYVVDADGAGYLVVRESFARGWTASVDGTATPVLRANGKHRAVPVPAGRHEVDLRYVPPGLGWGLGLSLLSAGAVAGVWLSGDRWPMIGRPPGARPRGEDREAGER